MKNVWHKTREKIELHKETLRNGFSCNSETLFKKNCDCVR